MACVSYSSERVSGERRAVPTRSCCRRWWRRGSVEARQARATQGRNPLMLSNAGAAPRQVCRTAADLLATPVPFGLPLGASAAAGPVVERGIATPASSSPTCSAAPFVRSLVPAQLGGAARHATRADPEPERDRAGASARGLGWGGRSSRPAAEPPTTPRTLEDGHAKQRDRTHHARRPRPCLRPA
jgi:hypothetical protein